MGTKEAGARTHISWGLGQWSPAPITSRLEMRRARTTEVVFTHTQPRSPAPPSESAAGGAATVGSDDSVNSQRYLRDLLVAWRLTFTPSPTNQTSLRKRIIVQVVERTGQPLAQRLHSQPRSVSHSWEPRRAQTRPQPRRLPRSLPATPRPPPGPASFSSHLGRERRLAAAAAARGWAAARGRGRPLPGSCRRDASRIRERRGQPGPALRRPVVPETLRPFYTRGGSTSSEAWG